MKDAEIENGAACFTYIGDELAPVRVVHEAPRTPTYGGSTRKGARRWWVRREGEQQALPKPRTAAALRPRAVASRAATMPEPA